MDIDEKITISLMLDYYGKLLKEPQRNMMMLKFNDDLSLSEISESQGITRQGVLDVIQRSTKLLYEYEERLKLLERNDKLKKQLIELKYIAEKNNNEDIKSRIDLIINGLEEN